jgi:hypothetical protein
MAHRTIVARKHLRGHIRHVQSRVQKAINGTSDQDYLIQAALGALCAAAALRLLRLEPVGRLVSGIVPMAVFAALWKRSALIRAK